jgi:hypothetical protein
MRDALVFLGQGVISIWLLFLAFWIWAIRFNKYSDLSLVDCDADAEALLNVCFVLLWSTTLLIWISHLIFKYRYKDKSLYFVSVLSAFISIASAPKAFGLMSYSAALLEKCRGI